MSFQYPWLLLGLLAAAVPIAIHLINRQRARVVRFAALEHLLLSDRRLAQRLKLRQLIVLALRVSLIAVLAVALAKPSLRPDVTLPTELSGPGAVAIVIDDSLSMNATRPGDDATLLERAIAEAEAIVAKGGPRTSFAVVAAGEPARILTQDVTYDRQAVARALASLVPSVRSGDMAGALKEAERVLAETGQRSRHVVIIGDQAAHAWEGIASPWALDEPPTVELIDVRDGAPIPNVAMTGVTVHPALDIGQDHVRITATATNYGAEPTSTTITLSLGERSAKSSLELPAGGRGEVSTTLLRPEAESSFGLASLPADALRSDDTWTFGLGEGEAVRVGLLNGAPHDVSSLDEAFFLRAALETSGPGAPLRTASLNITDMETEHLRHLDVVILANIASLPPAALAALRDFVQHGGGVFVTVGDRLTVEAARTMEDLLPIPLRGYKEVADPADPNAAISALHIADFDLEHPVTALFGTVDDVSLLKARTYRVALLDPTQRRARVLASFTGGIPALVEGQLGEGRSMLLTTTVDRDWSDLAIRTSFVPLIHQILGYLARRGEGLSGSSVRVGESAQIRIPPGRGGLVLNRPDGAEVMLDPPTDDSDRPTITLQDIDVVGRYTLRRRGGTREAVHFTAHADPRESDLQSADAAPLRDVLARTGPNELEVAAFTTNVNSHEGSRHPLWPYLLVGLFGLLVSESWLVLRQ